MALSFESKMSKEVVMTLISLGSNNISHCSLGFKADVSFMSMFSTVL